MKTYKKILCILGISVLTLTSVVGCNKKTDKPSDTELTVSETYENDNKVVLKSGDREVEVYMPDTDITDTENDNVPIVGMYYDDDMIEQIEGVYKYSDLTHDGYDRIRVGFEDNTTVSYQLYDNVKDENTVFDENLSTEIEINNVKMKYIITELGDSEFLYHVLISLNDTDKVLVNIQTNTQLTEDQLYPYVERLSTK